MRDSTIRHNLCQTIPHGIFHAPFVTSYTGSSHPSVPLCSLKCEGDVAVELAAGAEPIDRFLKKAALGLFDPRDEAKSRCGCNAAQAARG